MPSTTMSAPGYSRFGARIFSTGRSTITGASWGVVFSAIPNRFGSISVVIAYDTPGLRSQDEYSVTCTPFGRLTGRGRRLFMKFAKEFIARPGKKVKLSKWDPDETLGHEKGETCDKKTSATIER